ncbi:4Fe-4S dicluster domain-containing protein [Desulfosediminicola ganghwensis]|uniref:4Fe-4S dicluster domain-containing protein n=1 Tax=Desulfosediminicola ganghwensis TaxID=2569540 RepID=UPI0010ABF77B|nr:4Fe-4S dicluster domain-containing protein [Desulfosediminicola ganghwensis]
MKTRYVMLHDENRCIGCQACSVACRSVNQVPETVSRLQVHIEGPFGATPNLHFKYPRISCQQCENPPCVTVCPTGASYIGKEDGIVSIKQKLCVGCMYCLAACPYKVRFINPVHKGADKCNFCKETRLKEGKQPACVSICPTGALMFGDANNPESEVAKVLDTIATHRNKTHLGTRPKLYVVPTKKGRISL